MWSSGLAMHPAAQHTHQDIKDKVPKGSSESYGIEASLRKKCSCRVLHEFAEAIDGGDELVGLGIVP
jgi:hypothetical protein